MKAVSQKDVARKAGVSTASVSLVINGKGDSHGLSKSTQENIRLVSREMGYTKNYFASALRSKRTKLVIIISSALGTEIKINRRQILLRMLKQRGYDVLTEEIFGGGEAAEILRESEKFRAAGVIIDEAVAGPLAGYLDRLHEMGVPAVLIDGPSHRAHDHFRISRELAGRMGTAHLFEQGYREVYYVLPGFRPGRSINWKLADRYRGFRAARREFGRGGADTDFLIDSFSKGPDISDYRRGYEAGAEFIRRKMIFPAGVMCSSDRVAVGFMKRLLEEGVSIPEEAGVVGSENLPESEYACIPLTTVEFPVRIQAAKACDALVRRIEGRGGARICEEIVPEMRVRRSSLRNGLEPLPAGQGLQAAAAKGGMTVSRKAGNERKQRSAG